MFADLAGWLPAVILPLASGIQLSKIVKERSASGISPVAWVLFGVANLGAYVFAEKYFAIQSVLAFLLTAFINFAIAATTLIYKQ